MRRARQRLTAVVLALSTVGAPFASVRAQTNTTTGIVPCPRSTPAATSPVADASPAPNASLSPVPSPIPAPAPLRAAPAKLQLNAGMCAQVAVSNGVAPYVASSTGAVTASVQPDGSVLVAAVRNGRDVVTIADANGATATVPVLVAPDAGVLPVAVALNLAGAVAPDFAASALGSEIARRAHLQPGARIASIDPRALPRSFAAGSPFAGSVAVVLDGRDRWRDVAGTVPVTIELVDLPRFEPTQLLYSDDPETVVGNQAGVLFRAPLAADTPFARLYAYHLFDTTARRLYVLLRSRATSHVQILGAVAGPGFVDDAGHKATLRYMTVRRTRTSVIATLDADPVLLEIGNPSEALRLIMGIYDLRLIDGGPVDVAVVAGFDPSDPAPSALADAPPSQAPAKDPSHRSGVYVLDAVGPIDLSATVIDPQFPRYRQANSAPTGLPGPAPPAGMSVVVGTWAVPPVSGTRYLGGDYGVVRQLRLTMTNTSDQPGTIYLYVAPSSISVTTTISFDGSPPEFVSTPCLHSAPGAPKFHDRYLLKAFTVAPTRGGAPVVVTGEYMTDGGSVYPIELGLTLDPPSPMPAGSMCKSQASPSPSPSSNPSPSASPAAPAPSASP